MTEHTTQRARRTVTLPGVAALELLVRWANEGPASLVAQERPAVHVQRTMVMTQLRRLVTTLDIPAPMRNEIMAPVRGRDFGELSVELLGELARRARLGGYVTAGCRARVPLTPVRAHVLNRLSWGATYSQMAREDGGRVSALTEAMGEARAEHGCATTAQLVATAFRNGWLPGQDELNVLTSGRMVWDRNRPGYDRPPYKGII